MKPPSSPDLQYQVLHLNGSGRDLEDQYRAAHDAVHGALDQLRSCAPHMRDYYPLPNGTQAYERALVEHAMRCARLTTVRDDLAALCIYCKNDRLDRERGRTA